jgi:hypothetical protein
MSVAKFCCIPWPMIFPVGPVCPVSAGYCGFLRALFPRGMSADFDTSTGHGVCQQGPHRTGNDVIHLDRPILDSRQIVRSIQHAGMVVTWRSGSLALCQTLSRLPTPPRLLLTGSKEPQGVRSRYCHSIFRAYDGTHTASSAMGSLTLVLPGDIYFLRPPKPTSWDRTLHMGSWIVPKSVAPSLRQY